MPTYSSGRVGPDVGEVEIKREQNPGLGAADPAQSHVLCATQALIVNGVAVPSGCAKSYRRLVGHALVELGPHDPYAGSGNTRSSARSAAYASAA